MYNFGFICLPGVAPFVKTLQKNAFFVTFSNPGILVQIHDNQMIHKIRCHKDGWLAPFWAPCVVMARTFSHILRKR